MNEASYFFFKLKHLQIVVMKNGSRQYNGDLQKYTMERIFVKKKLISEDPRNIKIPYLLNIYRTTVRNIVNVVDT